MPGQGQLLTPEQLWEGYDPSKEPMDIEVLSEWVENGHRFMEVYFTGRTIGIEKTRIYGIYSTPKDGKQLPGILHVHGGGQTVNKDILRYWNERGYAALSYNWGGIRKDGQPYTLWGSSLSHANQMEEGARMLSSVPDVRSSSWYEWMVAGMRALTLLAEQDEVDPGRLGAFGISMGGTLMWKLAAMDKRIRTGCAVYGLGWHTYKEELQHVTLESSEYSDDDIRIWKCGMEPEAYAPLIQSPILYLSGTNDFYGKMDNAFDIVAALPAQTPSRLAFTPGYNHYVHWEQADNIHKWMDTWLKGGSEWPETPVAAIGKNEEGELTLFINPDAAYAVTRVEAYYAIDNAHAVSRHWRQLAADSNEMTWAAPLHMTVKSSMIYVYANVYYESGICISSQLLSHDLHKEGEAYPSASIREQPIKIIYDGRNGLGGWLTNSPNADPIPNRYNPIATAISADGVNGFRPHKELSPITYILGDSEFRGMKGEVLSFQILSREKQQFKIIVQLRHFPSHSRSYIYHAILDGSGKWQSFIIEPQLFTHEESGLVLTSWEDINYLELQKPEEGWQDEQILFSNFQWIPINFTLSNI